MDRKEDIDFKAEIKKVLSELKFLGYDRRIIEKGLGVREFYVDQVLSKGGNKIFLESITRYLEAKRAEAGLVDGAKSEDIILALRATVHVLTLELIELKSFVRNMDQAKVSKAVEKRTQQERELLLRDHSHDQG